MRSARRAKAPSSHTTTSHVTKGSVLTWGSDSSAADEFRESACLHNTRTQQTKVPHMNVTIKGLDKFQRELDTQRAFQFLDETGPARTFHRHRCRPEARGANRRGTAAVRWQVDGGVSFQQRPVPHCGCLSSDPENRRRTAHQPRRSADVALPENLYRQWKHAEWSSRDVHLVHDQVNVNRLGLPAIKLWAYEDLWLFAWVSSQAVAQPATRELVVATGSRSWPQIKRIIGSGLALSD